VDVYYIMKKLLIVYDFGIITITGFNLCGTCTKGPIKVAVLSRAQVYSRLIAGISCSNPAEDMGISLLCLLCVL